MPADSWAGWTGVPDPVTGYVQPPPEPTLVLAGNPDTAEVLAKQTARAEARLRAGQMTTADDAVASRQRWAERTIAQHHEAGG
jgi:hypothetical protein